MRRRRCTVHLHSVNGTVTSVDTLLSNLEFYYWIDHASWSTLTPIHSLCQSILKSLPDYFWCFPDAWTVAFLHIDQRFLLSSFNFLDILLKRAKRVFIRFFF
ncbi:hypothetical protein NC653_007052 [Populus alba x Populus x berolinensis]|uniref:Uncharacterized protein n=1 Tax=Populus alba x Populus x berolinensis TaxID=444605 RepID=A0AAD6WCY4_9ROSI|nr:hypothetical protein NC653_007052 [Populus alba x Populus x berolinensis]